MRRRSRHSTYTSSRGCHRPRSTQPSPSFTRSTSATMSGSPNLKRHGKRWLAQRPGRTGAVTPTAGDLWLGTAAEPVSVSEDVAQVTQGLELLRDAYGRVRTCEHVQRIALFDRDEPEKYCATCESRL